MGPEIISMVSIETARAELSRGSTVISFEAPFEAICSIPRKPYGGTITVTYTPAVDSQGYATLLEWNSFAAWLQELRSAMLLAEEMAHLVADTVWIKVVPESLRVELEVHSAFHLPVRIEVSLP